MHVKTVSVVIVLVTVLLLAQTVSIVDAHHKSKDKGETRKAAETKSTENDTEELIESPISKGQIYAIIGILSFGLAFVLIRLIINPWPTVAGTDTFSHMAAINQIIHNQGTDNIIGGYSYVFHTIIALLVLLSGANPLFVMINITSFVYPFSLLLSFLLSKHR